MIAPPALNIFPDLCRSDRNLLLATRAVTSARRKLADTKGFAHRLGLGLNCPNVPELE